MCDKDNNVAFKGSEKSASSPRKKLLSKILFRVLPSFLPAFVIELLAILCLKGASVSEDEIPFVAVTHAAAILCLVLALLKPKIHTVFRLIPVIFSPFATFMFVEHLTHDPFLKVDGEADMTLSVVFLNVLFYVLLLWVSAFVIGHTSAAVIISTVFPLVLALISYFTLELRGTPLFPWDLASYGTAASVISEYDLALSPKLLMIVSLAVLTCTLSAVWNVRIKFPVKYVRAATALIVCALMLFSVSYVQTDEAISDYKLYPYLFTPVHLYKTNGFAVSFLMNLRYATVDKPSGYSAGTAQDYAENYTSDEAEEKSSRPNVIVIMNESFADMSYLCDYQTNYDCMPFISSLSENTAKGKLHVSVVGGNTPNSEFEFLTGMTMGFLPSGSIPYQQFIKSSRPSLVSQLSDLGYTTVAMHPYGASGWERDDVYSYFGFDETYFSNKNSEIFTDKARLRTYVSDSGLYEAICERYEEKAKDEPLFVFAVTMQNHSGYSKRYVNFFPDTYVKGLENNTSVSTYMSLIKESDKAFEELVTYFSNVDEDTVILMFGDHQPNDSVANPLLKNAGVTYSDEDLVSSENRYTVPYVLWTNFETEYDAPSDVSLNYLSTLLTEAAGLPQTAAQKQLSDIMKSYPVVTGRCIIDSTGKISPVSDYENHSELSEYAVIQYNYLFDSGDMVKDFFSLK